VILFRSVFRLLFVVLKFLYCVTIGLSSGTLFFFNHTVVRLPESSW